MNTSLKIKILIFLGTLLGITIMVIGATFWVNSIQQDFARIINVSGRQRMLSQKMTKEVQAISRELETLDKTRKLVNQLIETRNHLARTISLQDRFDLNEKTAGFIPARAGREISEKLTKGTPLSLKQTSLKVRNPLNKPDEFEIKVLKEFEKDRSLDEYNEIVKGDDGIKYLRYMKRLLVQKPCLKCHDTREKAPSYIRNNYPDDQAFGYKEGDIRGAISARVPIYGSVADYDKDLKKTREIFEGSLKALINGGEVPGMGVSISAASNQDILTRLNEGSTLWSSFKKNLDVVMRPDISVDSDEFRNALTFIEENNVKLLNIMNDVTTMYQADAEGHVTMLMWFQGISLLLALGVIVFAFIKVNKMIVTPLNIIEYHLETVAAGDLTSDLEIRRNDEIGKITSTLNSTTENLRHMVRGIKESTGAVGAASGQIFAASEQVMNGAGVQHSSIERTSIAISEMNSAVKETATNSLKLSNIADEAASSALQISASIDEVAKIAEELSYNVEEVSSSITEMAASVREITGHASHLSQYTTDTAVAVTQINTTIKEVEENLKISERLAETTEKDAEKGKDAVDRTIRGMASIKSAVDEAAGVIKRLGTKSEDIGNILNVINDITDQTNLLALNAAIIAAQAGEHGKGFAVVADEIKELAERTSSSTREITEMIQSVQSESSNAIRSIETGSKSVDAGVGLSREAGEALNKIIRSANTSKQMTEQITKASAEQLRGSQQVAEAMEKISDMLARVYKAIEDQEKGSSYIAQAAERMKEGASQVKRATREQSKGGELITKAIENVSEMVDSISKATQEQARGGQEIVRAVEEIKEITEKNVESIKKMRDASDILILQTEALNQSVEKFTV